MKMRTPRQNIILTGMPAVGKSTVGVLLAKRLPLYRKTADITVQAAGVTPDQLVSRIIDRLKNESPVRGEMEQV